MTERLVSAFTARERAVLLGVSLIVVAGAGLSSTWQELAESKRRLSTSALGAAAQVSHGVAEATTLVSALYAFFHSAGEIPVERFPVLVEKFLDAHGQVAWMGYATRVDPEEVPEFESQMELDGFINFTVKPSPGASIRVDPEYHLPVTLIEPFEPRIATVLGRDLLTDPDWRRALEIAVDTGQVRAVRGRGLGRAERGYLLLRATYRGTVEPGTVADRRNQLAGMILVFLDEQSLLAEAVRTFGRDKVRLKDSSLVSRPEVSARLLRFDPQGRLSPLLSIEVPIPIANLKNQLWVGAPPRIVLTKVGASVLLAAILLVTLITALRWKRMSAQVERAAYAKAVLAETTLSSVGDAVIRVGEFGELRYLNPRAQRLTGLDAAGAVGRQVAEVLRLQDGQGVILDWAMLRLAIDAGETLCMMSGEPDEAVVSCTLTPVFEEDEQADGFVLLIRDVTLEHQLARRLHYQARHDPLTELPNRREFEHELRTVVAESANTLKSNTVLYLDLDQFKLVNDTCGHAAGDEMLRQLSGMFAAQCSPPDVLARLGGDEFGVLLRECEVSRALQVAQRLCDLVNGFRFTWDGRVFELGVSIGVVGITSATGTAEDVLRAADLACYAAKDTGRNRYHVYRPDDHIIARNEGDMKWQDELKRAIADDRLVLHGQPIVSIRSGNRPERLCELLLRMRTRDGSLTLPMAFIPAAERYGLMNALDREVIEHAFRYVSGAPDDGIVYSINLSGQSMSDAEFVAHALEASSTFSVDPRRVCFEVTETSAISNLNQARRLMGQLRDAGFMFALDDFGAGLSSLSYLKQLPVDFLKIDGQFIRGLDYDPVANSMVMSIVNVARVLRIKTVAEMVEDERAVQRLQELGVDYVQGFYIGKPRPIVEVIESAMIA